MLVLSRGRNDKVVFPTLGITIEILRLAGNRVRLGIDAPRSVPVLRDEIVGKPRTGADGHTPDAAISPTLSHSVRNRLQKATLGLALVQKMLEMGRTEDLEPTIFKIFNDLKSLEAELAPAEEAPPVEPAPRNCRRALVVEDDANESELLAGYLRLSGFEVSTAMDGLQAMVQLSRRDRPDVVLLDMKMPRFDGRKTVSAIRQNPDYRNLKIVAVSGMEPREAEVDVGPRGVDCWFQKPIDPAQLVSAIEEQFADVVALR